MVIFHSYVSLPEGRSSGPKPFKGQHLLMPGDVTLQHLLLEGIPISPSSMVNRWGYTWEHVSMTKNKNVKG
jgi:hypothetical protein